MSEAAGGSSTLTPLARRWPGFELCTAGLRHLEVNYSKAAESFSKAADLGDAWGIFNLGMMHKKGIGFPRDSAKAHALFLRAAAQDPTKEFVEGSGEVFKNFGVPESCHEIGLAFILRDVEGVGVDYMKAFEWFGKALEFGHSLSAYFIGLMFLIDDNPGIPTSIPKGMDYLKLAVHLKVVFAHVDLVEAVHYHNNDFRRLVPGKCNVAQEYFHFAVLNGSIEVAARRREFVRDPILEQNFDADKFAAALEKDVRRSAVVGPILAKMEEFEKGVKPRGFGGLGDYGRVKEATTTLPDFSHLPSYNIFITIH